MNILQRAKRKFRNLMDDSYLESQKAATLKILRTYAGQHNIYLFCAPSHSNIGDQAQYFCWMRLFKQWYPGYNVIGLHSRSTTDKALTVIKENAGDDDKFFIHSGYLIYDPHPELPFICHVVDTFHNHPITILPQTINLMSENKKKEVADCFNAHPDLTVISRDNVSLKYANELFTECSRLCRPDVVTSLIGDFQYNVERRDGILFCIRHDGEKYYTEEQIEGLKRRFADVKIDESDTTLSLLMRIWDSKREYLIRNVIESFATYQLVITDRYHGTIFSQIANTPVIVISSNDHKLVSGVKWFPKEYFCDNVFFAKSLDDAYNMAQDILKRNGKVIKNPPYFKDKYYSKGF